MAVAVAAAVMPPAVTRAQVVLQPGLGVPGGATVPSPGYDLALAALAEGRFAEALQIAAREYQGSVKAGGQRWIDSIATAAIVGECQYELGNLREAVAAYDEALLLSASHPDWLLAVQFPLQPLQPLPKQRVATWGRSQRNTVPAALPGTMSIRQGAADPQQVLQKGGVLSAPVNYPVRPVEIVRSLVMAIYRRTEILGELARESAPLDESLKALLRRPAPPNHFSQSWIDVALGTAYWSQGKPDQAIPLLNRGLLVGDQLDHPLTSWGLIVLGRIALDGDQAAAAAKLFEEATFTAADYGDARALEEAFRLAFVAHAVAGTRGIPPSIAAAAEWSRGGLPSLRARLLAMAAEAQAAAGDARGAVKTLADIDAGLSRAAGRAGPRNQRGWLGGDLGRGSCGAQAAYAAALAAHAAGDTAAGDAELEAAMVIARQRSPRLFQASRLVELVVAGSGAISERQADAVFSRLLGDPSARDFVADPLGTLAAISSPRTEAFEAWILAASRRGNDPLLAAAETAVRSRWLSARPLGGRHAAIDALIAADPATLPRDDATRRAALLARHPELATVLDRMTRIRTTLAATLVAAGDPAAAAEPSGDWREYEELADRCRRIVAAIAAGRDPTRLDVPPLTAPAEIRRRLQPRQLILSFHWTAAGLFGSLESHERVAVWQVRQPAVLAKEIAALARSINLFDPVAPVSADRLVAADWEVAARRVETLLFENSKVRLDAGIDELVIVPDGLLWYVPFELLPAGSSRPDAEEGEQGESKRLRDACRIRYCPTRSLAVARFASPREGGPVGIHAGRLFRGDRPDVGKETVMRLTASLDRAVPLGTAGGVPTALVGSLVETLVVLDELDGDGPVAARPLVAPTNGRGGVTFGEWIAPPPKRPRRVVLPGLQTAMAGGLERVPARPGEDLFLAVTDLLAAGARTALVSRWRVGGRTSVDLVEEFLRDLGSAGEASGPTAAESWHRAVDLVMQEPPDLSREPRVKPSPKAAITDARHPFFWSGYLLVDCGTGVHPEPPAAPAARPARPAAEAPPGQAAEPRPPAPPQAAR